MLGGVVFREFLSEVRMEVYRFEVVEGIGMYCIVGEVLGGSRRLVRSKWWMKGGGGCWSAVET